MAQRVAILGGGIIGVTTAWYLAQAGYDVTVVEENSKVAQGSSFANAGELSVGYSAPWASPGVLRKAAAWLLMRHGPLIIKPRLDATLMSWLTSFVARCSSTHYARSKSAMIQLAAFSLEQLASLVARSDIAFDYGSGGTLQLFRSERERAATLADRKVLEALGISHEMLDHAGVLRAEPGLAFARTSLVGGLRLPGDATGDCQLFAASLAQLLQQSGVSFRYRTTVRGLLRREQRIVAADTSEGPVEAEHFVVALGSHTSALLRPLKVSLPVYPVKGYSLTMPIADVARAPRSTVMDERHKIAITRLGDRIRVGGIAELAGFDMALRPARRAALHHSLGELFPGAACNMHDEFWCGLRPMTPDGPPVIGRLACDNLFVNSGHGTLGWTMACGSGFALARMIAGRDPPIDCSPFDPKRYQRRIMPISSEQVPTHG